MAVYTPVSMSDAAAHLAHYDLGAVERIEPIAQGVENTNYHLFTDAGRYVLTLFEKRTDPVDLPFFFSFAAHLADHGVASPRIVTDRDGAVVRNLNERPAAIITFLGGHSVAADNITPAHCAAIGNVLARMHKAGQTFDQKRTNGMGMNAWRDLAARTRGRADEIMPGLADLIGRELLHLERNLPAVDDVAHGAVHADLFPDNVFFTGHDVSGVIDFYFSCTDALAYDLMLTANAWCFSVDQKFLPRRWDDFFAAYQAERKVTKADRASLSVYGRAAALRILLTRLNDWIFHPPGAMVMPKDPADYIRILQWHQNHDIGEI